MDLELFFKNKDLLKEALTHSSYANQFRVASNERLEFIGDKVVNLLISDFLWRKFPHLNEGEFSLAQARLASTHGLSSFAKQLNLDEKLLLDPGEKLKGPNARALEDAFEAFFGALYLDQGYDYCRQFFNKHIVIKDIDSSSKDPKSQLQEFSQKNGFSIPQYSVIETAGSAHEPLFTIEVKVDGLGSATACAGNKKAAQIQAAQNLMNILGAQ